MINFCLYCRRKFRSQTSDNMDRWTAEMGRVREKRRAEERRAEQKREDQRRELVRRKKMQVREKVGKSRNSVFFQWFVAPLSKSRLAKAAGAEPSGQMRDEKLHALVVRSTFPSQNVQSTTCLDHLEVAMSKKGAPLWHEAHFEVKMYKTH